MDKNSKNQSNWLSFGMTQQREHKNKNIFHHNRSINLTDLVEESIVDSPLHRQQQQHRSFARYQTAIDGVHFFEPSEITGRSTSCTYSNVPNCQSSPTVEQILANSFASDVRELTSKLENFKFRTADSGRKSSLPRTADISRQYSSIDSFALNDHIDSVSSALPPDNQLDGVINNEDFVSANKFESAFLRDEKSWQEEYADVPAIENNTFGPLQLTCDSQNFSIGQFFSQRSEDLMKILPLENYRKHDKAYALVDLDQKEDERCDFNNLQPKEILTNELSFPSDQPNSLLSVSTIAKHLHNDRESPKTLANKFLNKQTIRTNSQLTNIIISAETPNLTATNKVGIIKDNSIRENISSDTVSFTESLLLEANVYRNGGIHPFTTVQIDTNIKKNRLKCVGQKRSRSIANGGSPCQSPEQEIEIVIDDGDDIDDDDQSSDKENSTPAKLCQNLKAPKNKFFQTPSVDYHSQKYLKIQLDNLSMNASKSITKPSSKGTATDALTIHKVQSNSKSPTTKNTSPTLSSAMSLPRFYTSKTDGETNAVELHPSNFSQRSKSISPTLFTQTNSQYSSTNDVHFPDQLSYFKSTHSELCWPSVKLQKTIKKSLIIKNTSNQRLSLKMEITGPGFQMCGVQQSSFLVLQTQECRTLTVNFCPTVFGPAIGSVCFSLKHRDSMNSKSYRMIYLYGYGGHTTMKILGINRGPIPPAFLTLGHMDGLRYLFMEQTFRIYNRGPLRGVAIIAEKQRDTQDFLSKETVYIEPKKCIIEPDSFQDVSIKYLPDPVDKKKMLKTNYPVYVVATLTVTLGDDPNRQRIAALLSRCKDKDHHFSLLGDMVSDFPYEKKEDFSEFQESEADIRDLFGQFKSEDIALTIDRLSLNDTSKLEDSYSTDMDNTILFRTLGPMAMENLTVSCEPNLNVQSTRPSSSTSTSSASCARSTSKRGDTIERTTSSSSTQITSIGRTDGIIVYPQRLNLNPFTNNTQTLQLINSSNITQTFEMRANFPHMIQCIPSSGRLDSNGDRIDAYIKIMKTYIPIDPLYLTIYTENDKIIVPVFVDHGKIPANLPRAT